MVETTGTLNDCSSKKRKEAKRCTIYQITIAILAYNRNQYMQIRYVKLNVQIHCMNNEYSYWTQFQILAIEERDLGLMPSLSQKSRNSHLSLKHLRNYIQCGAKIRNAVHRVAFHLRTADLGIRILVDKPVLNKSRSNLIISPNALKHHVSNIIMISWTFFKSGFPTWNQPFLVGGGVNKFETYHRVSSLHVTFPTTTQAKHGLDMAGSIM